MRQSGGHMSQCRLFAAQIPKIGNQPTSADIHGNEAGEQIEEEDRRAVEQGQSSLESTDSYLRHFLLLTHISPFWRTYVSNDSNPKC